MLGEPELVVVGNIYECIFVIGEFGGSGTLAGCGSGDVV